MSKQCVTLRSPRHTALSCVVATTTAAVALSAPAIALADEPATSAPTEEPSATTTAAATPSMTAPYTTTQTVVNNEQAFPTKDGAQSYLDNAKATWAEEDKKDDTSTYEVKTTGPEKVGSTTTSTTTTVKDEQKEFGTLDEAKTWIEDNTSGYQNAGDTTYDVTYGVEEVKSGTTEEEGTAVASGEEGGFESEQKAAEWVGERTKNYLDNSYYKIEKYVQKEDPSEESATRQSRDFYSKDARDKDLAIKKSDAENSGWTVESTIADGVEVGLGTKLDYKSTSYTFAAQSYAIIKQGQWFVIWTPEEVSSDTIESIIAKANDASLDNNTTYKGCFFGFGQDNQPVILNEPNVGKYWVEDNANGTYTMCVDSKEKISHLDYGTLTPKYTYSLYMTRIVNKWKASYKVSRVTKVPTYKYKAWYKVTKTEKVTKDVWKAGYEVVKTTTFAPPVTPPTTPPTTPPVTPPTTPKTPETPKAAVQKAAVQKQVTVAKAAVPRTSDSTNLAGAGILAGLAVTFGAAGIVLRRRARKLD